jgi:hypothetical protein
MCEIPFAKVSSPLTVKQKEEPGFSSDAPNATQRAKLLAVPLRRLKVSILKHHTTSLILF